jgi:plastocyanin
MLKQVCKTVAIACLFGCGGGYTSPVTPPINTPPPTNGISVENNLFSPASETVSVGTTVQWAWNSCTDTYNGQTCVTHDIVFDDGSGITSGSKDQGTFSRMFSTAGTYNYHCSIHTAAVMSGSITVQ